MASERVGFKAQVKWLPTDINTTSEIWIDWWGYHFLSTSAIILPSLESVRRMSDD